MGAPSTATGNPIHCARQRCHASGSSGHEGARSKDSVGFASHGLMVWPFRWSGRTSYRTGSSRERHDDARCQSRNTAVARNDRGVGASAGYQSEDGRQMAEAQDCRGLQDWSGRQRQMGIGTISIGRSGSSTVNPAEETPQNGNGQNDKRRYRIEGMFGGRKDWRRVATRQDRCPKVFLHGIALASGSGSRRRCSNGSAVVPWPKRLIERAQALGSVEPARCQFC